MNTSFLVTVPVSERLHTFRVQKHRGGLGTKIILERGTTSMRKNKMLRLASGMMVATLLSTSVISGTFAKYVTTGSASDTAVVAKWGVTVSASGSLFGTKYSSNNSNPVTEAASGDSISVETKNSSNVVAPGTKSEHGLTYGITGTPEVSTKVSAEIVAEDIYLAEGTYGVMEQVTVNETNFATLLAKGLYTSSGSSTSTEYSKVSSGTDYSSSETYYALAYTAEVEKDGYYPVAYSSTANKGKTKATDIATEIAQKFITLDGQKTIAEYDGDKSTARVSYTGANVAKTFGPNVKLDSSDGINIGSDTITWEWTFGAAETAVGTPLTANSNDARDTILGDLMSAGATNSKVVKAIVANNVITGVTLLTVDSNSIVKAGENEVGCLKTEFNIKFTVEQVN
jgi:hypothetical protein